MVLRISVMNKAIAAIWEALIAMYSVIYGVWTIVVYGSVFSVLIAIYCMMLYFLYLVIFGV